MKERDKILNNPKQKVQEIIQQIEKGQISSTEGWDKIKKLKEEYVDILNEQSWHSFIGNKFEKLVRTSIRVYVNNIREKDETLKGLEVLTTGDIKKKKNEVIFRKLAVRYGDYLLLPDTDLTIVDFHFEHSWESSIVAIISCKTSLRERIAQACYWKLKLLSSDTTKNIKVFLATVDNDKDFIIDLTKKGRVDGKSRNRIIAEYELDGVYILRENFKEEWESQKIKRYESIFDDLLRMFKKDK
jgi:hypothetical protein